MIRTVAIASILLSCVGLGACSQSTPPQPNVAVSNAPPPPLPPDPALGAAARQPQTPAQPDRPRR
jgi:hypothetical protein